MYTLLILYFYSDVASRELESINSNIKINSEFNVVFC